MAQKSGFFNALLTDGVYDRTYNANDYCDNLAVVISSGVLRSSADDLKITASGMVCTMAAGRAFIEGHYYFNDSPLSFAAVPAPIGGSRKDRIFLRMNKDVGTRSIRAVYVQGVASNSPVAPAPTRNGTIYDLCIAEISVATNAQSLTVTDTRGDASLCGWVYSTSGDDSFFTALDDSFSEWFEGAKDTLSSVTLFKRYNWRIVLQSAASTVVFNIPQYDPETCFIEVYVNGILESQGVDFNVNGSVIMFVGTLVVGTEVVVKAYKSIDGTGIESVSDEITALQNQVDAIEGVAEYTYRCVNSNDNISLSQIAQAIYAGSYTVADVTPQAAAFLEGLGGNTFLAAFPNDGQITINVIGTLGASTPFAGTGEATYRYQWFALGGYASQNRRVIFDFANTDDILIWCTGNTDNIIFFGTDLWIKNVNCWARCNAAGCKVEMIAGRYNYGHINVEDSRLRINTTSRATISENGTFINCYTTTSSSNEHALNFCPTSDALIRVIGGTHFAYCAAFANTSAIFYTYGTETNAVIMAQNISCPTKAISNFYQKQLSVGYAGMTQITGVVTLLASLGNYNSITGLISKSKQ